MPKPRTLDSGWYTAVIVSVLGSTNDTRFAVTNFTVASAPTTVFVTPEFGVRPTGCVVDCSGTLAAVGNYQSEQVAIYNISNPAAPALLNTFSTGLTQYGLTGIGALSLDGTNLLVGEFNGGHIVLIDTTKPQGSAIVSTLALGDFADGGVSAIKLHGPAAVACGNFNFDVLNYTTPSAPVATPYVPDANNGTVNFQKPLSCDFDGSTAVIGDNSGNVYAFSVGIGDPEVYFYIGTFPSGFVVPGVTSLAVMTGQVTQVAAGCIAVNSATLINAYTGPSFPPYPPTSNTIAISSNASGDSETAAPLAFYGYPFLVASTNNGAGITFFNVDFSNTQTGPTATVLGVAANVPTWLRRSSPLSV